MVSGALTDRLDERNREIAQHRKMVQSDYYKKVLPEAEASGKPVAHLVTMSFQEIFHAMDVVMCKPENLAAIVAARKGAKPLIEAAEARGMPSYTCGYARIGLGMMYEETGPYGRMPRPNIVVSTTLACDPHATWWEQVAEYYKVPLFTFEGPFIPDGKIEQYHLDWMVAEIKRLIAFIEENTGAKFDYDKFKEAMILSGKAHKLYQEIHENRKAHPCPRGLREMAGDYFYIILLLGTQEAVDYFTMIRDDVVDRVKNKTGVLPVEEKFRIYFENIPLWYNLQLFDYLADRGAVIPIDSYTAITTTPYYFDGNEFDPEKPFESYAYKWLNHAFVSGTEVALKRKERAIREWDCEGGILLLNRGCRRLTADSLYLANMLKQKYELPTMYFEADQADPKSFAEAEVLARVDAFLEILEQRKDKK
ncbi:2-hydroxyacyl-CoA dehydratase subunit D [Chloroflexota bacterium]